MRWGSSNWTEGKKRQKKKKKQMKTKTKDILNTGTLQ
jgi:hypothetical protein